MPVKHQSHKHPEAEQRVKHSNGKSRSWRKKCAVFSRNWQRTTLATLTGGLPEQP
jgi:hypothetical protein